MSFANFLFEAGLITFTPLGKIAIVILFSLTVVWCAILSHPNARPLTIALSVDFKIVLIRFSSNFSLIFEGFLVPIIAIFGLDKALTSPFNV